jgi:proline dehydrogenase
MGIVGGNKWEGPGGSPMGIFDRAVAELLPFVPKPLVGRFSRPYIAGSTLQSAVDTVRRLNAAGMMATLDVLGEDTRIPEQAASARDAYLRVLDEIDGSRLDSNVSVKLYQLGLKLDPELCFSNLRAIVARAAALDNFVRIDMEDSSCTDATLSLFDRLRLEFANCGVVLQAMLRRTWDDAVRLASFRAGIRLCKGIYVEPRRIAYQDRELINRNYALILEHLLEEGCYVGIATHDERLVWEALRLIRAFRLERAGYEFQMLLGVEEELRRMLVEDGHRLRVYVPFGEQWYAYSVRRLRENPRVAGMVARSVLRSSLRR